MEAIQAIVSLGDEGVLNAQVSPSLSDVWIDRDLSWLDINDRVLAEGVDARSRSIRQLAGLSVCAPAAERLSMEPEGVQPALSVVPDDRGHGAIVWASHHDI